jgi:hypothetical protein
VIRGLQKLYDRMDKGFKAEAVITGDGSTLDAAQEDRA